MCSPAPTRPSHVRSSDADGSWRRCKYAGNCDSGLATTITRSESQSPPIEPKGPRLDVNCVRRLACDVAVAPRCCTLLVIIGLPPFCCPGVVVIPAVTLGSASFSPKRDKKPQVTDSWRGVEAQPYPTPLYSELIVKVASVRRLPAVSVLCVTSNNGSALPTVRRHEGHWEEIRSGGICSTVGVQLTVRHGDTLRRNNRLDSKRQPVEIVISFRSQIL